MSPNENGWSEYEKLVLYRLDTIDKRLEELDTQVVNLRLKSSLWGALAGAVTGLTAAIGSYFHQKG